MSDDQESNHEPYYHEVFDDNESAAFSSEQTVQRARMKK